MPPLSLPQVRAAVQAKLHSSLLTDKHAQILHIQPMTEEMAAKAGNIEPAFAGFKIPYFNPDGSVTKDFFRYRFWPEARPSNGWHAIAEPSSQRYTQPKGTELHVYMPPLLKGVTWADVMAYEGADLDITEGELKSACACANGRIMLGLGGVFSWTSKRHSQPLIPILEKFKWEGRRVNIAFDSDKSSKPMVQLALSRLATTLTERGALVYDIMLPSAADGAKQGVDDFVATAGIAAYEGIVSKAEPVKYSLALHQLNDEVALVWRSGAASNIVRLDDGQIITPQQFKNSLYKDRVYMEYTLNAKGEPAPPRKKSAADEWLSWPCRTTVGEITYAPGQPLITKSGDYNRWRSDGVKPVRGDISPWEHLLGKMTKGLQPEHVLWFKRCFQ